MADPYESPEGETPIQRRERLMNLTNENWQAPPPAVVKAPADGAPEPAQEETDDVPPHDPLEPTP